ncbi:putative P-loop containing nucleoside triphosphate hydrolase [Helianthus anomalus]
MVLWVGREARYFRQNILNLSINLGLDVSADEEKERGRIRSFDEQETEAFKRVKQELFRDMPYLLIIDHLEKERDWWEGKDLHDLIPRNTGGSHVIITTRLPRVLSFDPMQLQPLSLKDAILLMKGRRKKEYPAQEIDILTKFDEKLGRSSFGLSRKFHLMLMKDSRDTVSFYSKVLIFCTTILHEDNGTRNVLASKMLLVGGWFAPLPITSRSCSQHNM